MSAYDSPCPHCGRSDCDTDCGERAAIYREYKREQLQDIDIDDMGECLDCRGPAEYGETYCYTCQTE